MRILDKLTEIKRAAGEILQQAEDFANQPIPPQAKNWAFGILATMFIAMTGFSALREVVGPPPPNDDVRKALDAVRMDNAAISAIKDGCPLRYSRVDKRFYVNLRDCKNE